MLSASVFLAIATICHAGDPQCTKGISEHSPPQIGDACCVKSCGQCGGSGCGSLPGGSSSCCSGKISKTNVSCSSNEPPCVIDDLGPSPTPPPASKFVSLAATLDVIAARVSPEFVSFTIDTSQLSSSSFPWHDDTIDLLTAALSPAHLRVGGTQADYEVYAIGDAAAQSCENLPSVMTDYRCRVFTQTMWESLLDFCGRNNVSLVFGLNDMFGRPTKMKPEKQLCAKAEGCPTRNQTNLEALLKWTAKNRPNAPIYAFELGNELNSCLNDDAGAQAQAADFVALAKLRDELWPNGKKIKLIGPDTHSAAEFQSKGLKWWSTFVEHAAGTVDAFTFHMYSMGNGPKLDPTHLAFLEPTALDKSREGAEELMKIMTAQGSPGELWGGETSSANDGGQSGITDTYINGFWYLDQLGSHANVGVQVFERQTFMQTHGYPMVNQTTLTPLPDYWTALLHKRLMGEVVLNVASDSSMLRAYAHCSRGNRTGVTLALLNLAEHNVTIKLGGGLGGKREEWILQAGTPITGAPNKLMSRQMLLNGKEISLIAGPKLPPLEGRAVPSIEALVVPATSYGFVQFLDVQAAACQNVRTNSIQFEVV